MFYAVYKQFYINKESAAIKLISYNLSVIIRTAVRLFCHFVLHTRWLSSGVHAQMYSLRKLLLLSTGWSKKLHKVYGTIILQPYVRVMWFSAKCSERNSLHD